MSRTLFIAGTDTGVGKTFVAERLMAVFVRRGLRVVGMKPVETGCGDGGEHELDGERLRRAANVKAPVARTCPYRLAWPASPLAAAEREDLEIDMEIIQNLAWRLQVRADILIVEGAGGLIVPVTKHADMIDMAADLEADVVLVARSGLGTINHTMLSIEALDARSVRVAGVVLNRVDPHADRELEESNLRFLTDALSVPSWGIVPRDADAATLEQLLDVDALVGER